MVEFLGTTAGLYAVTRTAVGIRIIAGIVLPVKHAVHFGMGGFGPAEVREIDKDDKTSRRDVERIRRLYLSGSLSNLIISVGNNILFTLSALNHLFPFARFAIIRQLFDPARVGRHSPNGQRNQTACQKSNKLFFH